MSLMAIRVSESVTSNRSWKTERARAQPRGLVIQMASAHKKKKAPWPHIDRLTFRMFNSYLQNREQAVANSLPNSTSHCSSFYPSHPPWFEPEESSSSAGMPGMEFLWMAVWPDSPLSVGARNTIVNNWTMVTSRRNGCRDPWNHDPHAQRNHPWQ